MDSEATELGAFASEVRTWLKNNAPLALLGSDPTGHKLGFWGGKNPKLPHPESKRWCEVAATRGYTALTWPKEYGGAGLDEPHAAVVRREMQRLGLPPPLVGFGLTMIGPTLLMFGSEAQKREHLPKITAGQIRWCQGYSEPNAGSDLASLATAAVLDGDEYVLNGQKIWTSYGDDADWMFVLTRTDPKAKKQQGITFLLIDMAQRGVEVRPIRLISGASPFCETFFTDARARVADVIGGVNNGWTVAKALLGHERTMIANVFGGSGDAAPQDVTSDPIVELARKYLPATSDGTLLDFAIRERITQLGMDHLCFMLTVQRNADNMKAGHHPGPETSLFKIYGTELNQRREELMLSIRGPRSLGWEGVGFNGHELEQTRNWLRSRGNTIEGGTSEVQLNIIAKRVLQLPGD